MRGNISKLIVSVGICLGTGFISGLVTRSEVNGWFRQIEKPSWNPPDWVFGPVWTTLYILMGIAFFLVWKKPGHKNKKQGATILFATQLLLNFLWSIIFFNQHLISLAFADIILLWILIVCCLISFSGISKAAALLLVPYLLWVSFAALLNYRIMVLN